MSVDFYRELIDKAKATTIVVVSYEPQSVMTGYLEKRRLHVRGAVQADPAHVRIAGTPMMFLLKSDLTISRIWRGFLSTDTLRGEVLQTVH
jgi:hypothetical protein